MGKEKNHSPLNKMSRKIPCRLTNNLQTNIMPVDHSSTTKGSLYHLKLTKAYEEPSPYRTYPQKVY